VKVLYTAAHGGFAREHAPLGGGAAVFEMLRAEWAKTQPFPLDFVTPRTASGHDIIRFDTSSYARFSRQFQALTTTSIRASNPADTVILVNDIAEGPDFKALRDYRIATIWHVDVVAYIAAIYCRGLIRPETLVRIHETLGALYPGILRLIFEKQADCVQYSTAHIVPSPAMKEIILRCYPRTDPAKIHVLPWGAPPALVAIDKQEARRRLGLPPDALVLITLSRLSPEKNQQLLLDALARWDRPNVHVLLCGGAAYMQGQKHEAMLRRKAGQLRNAKVHFPGHVYGEQKQLHFSAADLYVFPSSHESYGLTLMEAFQYGLPALTLDHAGARAVMRPEFGAIAAPATFLESLQAMVAGDLVAKGRAAQVFAREHPFANAATQLAAILTRLQF
jgi:glycosyltransferase involved in cell wall biosynthesis